MLEKAKELIKRWEGLRLQAYKCPAGVWTIGYGHTKTTKQGQTITTAQAEELLEQDITTAHKQAMRVVQVPLTEGQAAALVSFVFNVGVGAFGRSTLLRKLNVGDYSGAASEFKRWNKAGGRILPGLVARRAAEEAVFNERE